MKKTFSLIIVLLLIFLIVPPVFSAGYYVHDHAGLLHSSEIQALEDTCVSFRNDQGMELAYVTVTSLGGWSVRDYADHYFEEHFGSDGILFLIAMDEREWYISTSGTAIQALSDRDLAEIENEIIPYLSSGHFYDAFYQLQDILPDYLSADSSTGINILLSLLAGAGIAGITILIMRSSMNTRTPQRSAVNYEEKDSYHLRTHQDLFLYSNVVKRPRPQNNSSGSSTHRSSSGRSHGGRGGHF